METLHLKAFIAALILFFLSQGCSFYARLGSARPSPQSVEKTAASATLEKTAMQK